MRSGVRAERSFTDELKAGAAQLALDEGKTTAEVARALDQAWANSRKPSSREMTGR